MSDTTELQSLIDQAIATGSRHLVLPPRTWVLDRGERHDGGPCVTIPPTAGGLTICGSGVDTKLVMADGSPGSTRTIYVRAPGVTLRNLQFEGGAQADTDEHRAGIFVTAPGLSVLQCTSRGHTGDGLYLFEGSHNTLVVGCDLADNHRNGITFGGVMDGVLILNCNVSGNGAQQVDTEPGVGSVVSGLVINRCTIDGSVSNDYALTLGGSSADKPGHDVLVVDSTIRGGINLVWGNRIELLRCGVFNHTTKSSLDVSRACVDVSVRGCLLSSIRSKYGVQILGTGDTAMPQDVVLERTTLDCQGRGARGILASCTDTVRILGCTVSGNGELTAGVAGINLRAVSVERTATRATVEDTVIQGFGDIGLQISGNAVRQPDGSMKRAYLSEAWIRNVHVGNVEGSTSMRRPFVLDDGTEIVKNLFTYNLTGPDGQSIRPTQGHTL